MVRAGKRLDAGIRNVLQRDDLDILQRALQPVGDDPRHAAALSGDLLVLLFKILIVQFAFDFLCVLTIK